MIRHQPTLDALLSDVRAFVRHQWHPIEHEVEKRNEVPEEVVQELRQRGYFGRSIPEANGGLGITTEEMI